PPLLRAAAAVGPRPAAGGGGRAADGPAPAPGGGRGAGRRAVRDGRRPRPAGAGPAGAGRGARGDGRASGGRRALRQRVAEALLPLARQRALDDVAAEAADALEQL